MLKQIIDWLCYGVLALNPESRFSNALNFFIYDSIKIIILLFIAVAITGFLRTFINENRIQQWMAKKHFLFSHFAASLIGAITPFCSCSSIPLFFSFLRLGIPLGVSFSFLITSPLINEYLVVMMLAFFGWKITSAYILSGLFLGTILGILLGKMKLENLIEKDIINEKHSEKHFQNIKERILFGLNEAKKIAKSTWLWVLAGVAIGAIIHDFVPQEFINRVLAKGGALTVPIAVVIGIPIYGSCAAILPIAAALFQKGFPLGTALAFMMSVSALSLPSAILLRRAMKLKLIAIFFAVVTIGIIFTGYLFNLLA